MDKEQIQIKKAIIDILTILTNNFRYSYGKKISFEEIFEMMKDLFKLYNIQYVNDIILQFLELIMRVLEIIAKLQGKSFSRND